MTADSKGADAVIRFLTEKGWARDGQDPAVWISPDGSRRDLDLGDALMVQLVADNVGWPRA